MREKIDIDDVEETKCEVFFVERKKRVQIIEIRQKMTQLNLKVYVDCRRANEETNCDYFI